MRGYTDCMEEVGVHEAKTNLSRLLRRVEAGEEITIKRGQVVVAKLVPATTANTRRLGTERGRFQVPDDFDAPLDDEILEAFES